MTTHAQLETENAQLREALSRARAENAALQDQLTGRTAELLNANKSLFDEILAHQRLDEDVALKAELLDSSAEMILVADLDGKIRYVNQAAHHWGFTPGQLRQGGIRMFEPFAGDEDLNARLAALLPAQHRTVEFSAEKEGKPFYSEAHVRAMPFKDETLIVAVVRDITERVRAEQARQEYYAKIEKLFEVLPVGVSVLNRTGEIVMQNPALSKILEISDQDMDKGAYRKRQYLRPDGTPMPASEFASARVAQGEPVVRNVLTGIVTEAGHVLWMNVSATAVDFSDWRTVIVTRDVTAQREAEQAVENTRQNLEALIENRDDLIWSIDSQYRLITCNSAYLRTVERGIGKPLPPAQDPLTLELPAEVLSFWRESYTRALRGEAYSQAVPLLRSPDEIIEYRFNPIRNRENVITGVSVIGRDITMQKRIERQLRESERKYANLFDKSATPTVLIDLHDRTAADVNAAFEQAFGYLKQDIVGKTAVEFGAVVPGQSQRMFAELIQHSRVQAMQGEFLTRAGEKRDVLISANIVEFDGKSYALATYLDITDRKRAERELQASEEKYIALFEQGTMPIALIELNGLSIADANAAFTQLFESSKSELLGMTADRFGLDRYSKWADALAEFWQRGGVNGIEMEFFVRSGEERSALFSAKRIEIGGTPHALVTMQDITDLKRAESERNEIAARLELATRAAGIGIWDWDIVQNQLIWDKQMYALYGQSGQAGQIPGAYETWLNGIHPDDRAAQDEISAHTLRAEMEYQTEFRVLHPDGSIHWLYAQAQVVRDAEGKPLHMVGVNYDITDRKRAELEILAQNEQLRQQAELLDYAHVLVRDMDNRIVYWNRGMEQLYGWTRAEALGQVVHTFLQTQFPLSLNAYENAFYPAGVWQGELIHHTRAGKEITVASHHVLYRDASGVPQRILEVNNDITALKQAQVELFHRAQQLEAKTAELARASRLKDEFLAMTSHELRTPLNAVMGMAQVLQEETYGPLNPRQRQALLQITEGGTRLLSIVNNILMLSRITAGKIRPRLSHVYLQSLCETGLHTIQVNARPKNLTFSFATNNPDAAIWADEQLLHQVLLNLLSNAAKFTPDGGRILLEIDARAQEQTVHLSVQDTGIGIAPADQTRLFQPFVQLDSGLSRKYEGAGLGLAVVAQVVELHGGSVTLVSELGKGSRFTVALPIGSPPPDAETAIEPARQNSPDPGTLSASRARVLVADDHDVTCEMMREFLQARNFEVILAHDGRAAVEAARTYKPDIILMDIQMPELDGLEATRQIRADAALAHIPIVAVTALAMAGDRERCLEAGATAYLTKPILLPPLPALLREYIAAAPPASA